MDIDDRDWFSWSGIAAIRRKCEAQAVKEGLSGLELFMRGQELFSQAISDKPSYRERQANWKAKQLAVPVNPAIEALEAIAAGHNDARGLAQQVLKTIKHAMEAE